MALSPNTDNYLLGRGRLYFDRFNSSGQKQGWIDLGNAPDFSVNISKETLAHYSSRAGLRVKDLEVVKEIASSFQFTLEEFSLKNLELAFLGTSSAANQASGSLSAVGYTAHHDRWTDVGKRKLSNFVLKSSGGTATYVLGTDYLVDLDEGMFMALSTGSITDGATVEVTCDYAAVTQTNIASLSDAAVDGSLKFVGDPATGPKVVIECWKGKLMPSGEIGFISDDWAKFQLQFEVAKDETGHPSEPYFRVTYLD
jgi:hypothetical protein